MRLIEADPLVLRQRSASSFSDLRGRLVLFGVILALEGVPLSAISSTGGSLNVSRFLIVFGAFFLIFGSLRARDSLKLATSTLEVPTVRWTFLLAHAAASALFIELSTRPGAGEVWRAISAGAEILAIGFAALAFIPLRLSVFSLLSTGNAWAYAVVGAAGAYRLAPWFQSLWNAPYWEPLSNFTFVLVKGELSVFFRDVVFDNASLTIGTDRFLVSIGPTCSGLEGLGLMLIFAVAWLWFFRKEHRFPQSLLLIPAGMAVIFFLNSVRIMVLIAIGDLGAERVALGGFHSQAGWIAFSGVTLAFAVVARSLPWLSKSKEQLQSGHAPQDLSPTAAYLLPFLVILAASMVSRAASDHFEWLYPLRFFAGAAAILFLWRRYATGLDWRFSWVAPVTGSAVFVVWIVLDHFIHATAASEMPFALQTSAAGVRIAWIIFWMVSGIFTIPVADELAFRGFLLRRLSRPDFELMPFRHVTWASILVSSAIFGFLHGGRWLAATIAGILYALSCCRKGRFGEAVVAHATTNALLAVYVVAFQQWQLW